MYRLRFFGAPTELLRMTMSFWYVHLSKLYLARNTKSSANLHKDQGAGFEDSSLAETARMYQAA